MKKITIREIAKIAGVSPRTVTRAFQDDSSIKNEKRRKILDLCREYDYKPNIIASRLFGGTIRFGVCVENLVSGFTNELARGFMSAKEELLDYKAEIDIEILEQKSESEMNEERLGLIEIYKKRKYDGIIIFILRNRNDKITRALNESGMKIVCVNDIYYGVNSLFTVLNNCVLAGKMAFEILSLGMLGSERRNIAVFTGDTNLYVHKTLKDSFIFEAETKGVNSTVYDTKDTVELAAKYTDEIIERNDIGGIYISSANSVPVIEKIIASGKAGDIKIVASDIFPELNEYIRNGIIMATIFQNPYRQAKMAVMNLYYYIAEKRKIPEVFKITPQIVMRSNLEAYEAAEEIL